MDDCLHPWLYMFSMDGIWYNRYPKKVRILLTIKLIQAKVVAELLKYLQKNTTDKKSYPEQPSGVEQIQVVAGTYDSPTANTPASQILTGWAKTGYGPTTAAKDPEINTFISIRGFY